MINSTNWFQDFLETSEDILHDVILLEAMHLRMEQPTPTMTHVSAQQLIRTRDQVMDYLSQHTIDLYMLCQRLCKEC